MRQPEYRIGDIVIVDVSERVDFYNKIQAKIKQAYTILSSDDAQWVYVLDVELKNNTFLESEIICQI